MGAAAPAALADAGGRCKSAAAATAQRLRRSNPAAAAAAALVAPLLLLCFLASSIDAFVFPYPLLPTPQSQSQLQQPMQLLHAAPTLQARRALLALAAAPRCGPEEEEQAQAATKARRRPWRPASATVADRRYVRVRAWCGVGWVCILVPQQLWTNINKTHKHTPHPPQPNSDVLAAAAGVAAGSSWVLAAGAAATTTATAGSSKPAMAAAAGGDAYLCDDAISHLKDPKTGKEIYLIGTAHISNASAQVCMHACMHVCTCVDR